MRFFLDNCVAQSVAVMLVSVGHEVFLERDCMAGESPDFLVAIAAQQFDAILVSGDKDFQHYGKSWKVTNPKYAKLRLVQLRCPEVVSAQRLQEVLPYVALELSIAQAHSDQRLWIEVFNDNIRLHR